MKKFISLFLCLIILFCSIFYINISAQSDDTIKVGWFVQPGYQEIDENGNPCGYNYDYLMNIARHTGWKYDFVINDNFQNCYTSLQSGEVDLMGCIIYSDERTKEIDISRNSNIMVYTSLFVKKDSPVAPYDFKAFNGMVVACRDSQNPKDLVTYANENNFKIKLLYCDNVSEIEEAVLSGKADAGVLGGYQTTDKTRIVASFMPTPSYFATTKGNQKVAWELNRAMDAIYIDNPFYDRDLAYKYLTEVKEVLRLTKEEETYIKQSDVLEVLYTANWSPMEMVGEKGEFKGITADVFAKISEITGLKFKYTPSEKGYSGASTDMIAGFNYDYEVANEEGYTITNSYLKVPLVTVHKIGGSTDTNNTAVVKGYYSEKHLKPFEGENIILYDSLEDSLEAVLNGEADKAYINTYSAGYLLQRPKYRSLSSTAMHGVGYEIAIGIRNDLEPVLCSIINKTLSIISDEDISSIIYKNVTLPKEITLQTMIEDIPAGLIVVIATVLIIFILALSFILYKRTQYEKYIKKLLYTDALTGVLSFKGFEMKASKLITTNIEDHFYMVDFDLNHFEEYNTVHSYDAGNKLLIQLADLAKKYCGHSGICSRVQADHFVCLVTAPSKEFLIDSIENAVIRFRQEVANTSLLLSFGIYKIVDTSLEISAMCDCALTAKRTIKGNYDKFIADYDEILHKKKLDDVGLINRFEKALLNGELVPYYQPQYELKTEKIVGAEALVRWITSDGKMIMPDSFIFLLEENGLIGKLDIYMLEQVCKKIQIMKDKGEKILPISVNISRVHLYDAKFVDKIKNIAKKYQIPTSAIEIELTETAFLDNQHEMVRVIENLHSAGFLVAIDDFGSGFSSLNMLKDIDFDVIKIDKGFLSASSGTRRGETVICNMLKLAQDLELKTVAEGVETIEQCEFLRQYGCDIVQGYYFSRPVSEEQFDKLLDEEKNLLVVNNIK